MHTRKPGILRMKSLLIVSVVSCILPGISLSAIAQKHINAANYQENNPKAKSIKFIEGIEIKADHVSIIQPVNTLPVTDPSTNTTTQSSGNSPAIENFSALQFKYAQLLNCNIEDVKNISMYSFIDEWLETRYRYGGSTKKGVDCSAFTGLLMGTVYAIKLPRTAREQYSQSEKIGKEEMQEGDLVFFNTRGGISHVGVYLSEGYFVHASTNNGVTVSSLTDPYYESRFISGGRVINNTNTAISR